MLLLIELEKPSLRYCPLISIILAFLLPIFEEYEVFCLFDQIYKLSFKFDHGLSAIHERGGKTSEGEGAKTRLFLFLDEKELYFFVKNFIEKVKDISPASVKLTIEVLESHGIDIEEFCKEIFSKFFCDFFPFEVKNHQKNED